MLRPYPTAKTVWQCFPNGSPCSRILKTEPLNDLFINARKYDGDINIVQYLGIASDETERIARHINRKGIVLPLVDIDWQEDYCGLYCKYSGLLSPSYIDGTRDGCWFCHNQGVAQLRRLRRKHRNKRTCANDM